MTKYLTTLSLTIALGLSIAAVDDAAAKPKSFTSHCNCGCQYEGADGKLHFGVDVRFTSSQQCVVFEGNAAGCHDQDGNYHSGKYRGCETTGTTPDANLVEDPLYSRPPDAFDGNGDTVQGGQSSPGALDQFFHQLLGNGAAD